MNDSRSWVKYERFTQLGEIWTNPAAGWNMDVPAAGLNYGQTQQAGVKYERSALAGWNMDLNPAARVKIWTNQHNLGLFDPQRLG